MGTANEVTDKQRNTWNKFSGGWEKWDKWVSDWLEPIGIKLLEEADLQPTDRILDVSTGTGEPGLTAATMVTRVVATDVAEDMVEIARKNAGARGLENFEGEVADAEHLPFSDCEFDAAVCRLGTMYFASPAAGVEEIARVLKPGRKMALAAWAESAKNPWATTAAGVINKLLSLPPPPPDAPGVFRCSQPGVLSELMERAGLKEINQVEVTGEGTYDSAEHYWEFVMDVVAPVATPLSNADNATREQAKQAVIEATKPFQKNGKVVFPYSCWVASGQK